MYMYHLFTCMCVLYMNLNDNVVSLYKYVARLSSVFMFIYIFWPYMSRMHLNLVPVIRMWMFFACVAILTDFKICAELDCPVSFRPWRLILHFCVV